MAVNVRRNMSVCVCGRVHFDGSEGHERTNRRRTQSLCVLGNLCEFRLMEKKKRL